MSFGLPRGLYEDTASNALGDAAMGNSRFAAGLADSALQAKSEWEQARAYADAYQEERDKAIAAQKRAQQRKSRVSLASGIGDVLGTAASFIPVVGPIAGAALKGVGSLIG
jgi:hypothetical protein